MRRAHKPKRARTEEGRVRDLARGGDGVVEMPSGLWFVPGTLPGERVRARELASSAKAKRGQLLEVLDAHARRVTPECPHHAPCGGCPMMHAEHAFESEIKLGFVQQMLERLGASDVEADWVQGSKREGYRTRARLAFDRTGRRMRLGFRRARSREVTDIPACLVLDPALAAALSQLRERLFPVLDGEGELSLSLGAAGRAAVVLRTRAAQPPEVYEACRVWAADLDHAPAGIALWVQDAGTPATWGEPTEQLWGIDDEPLVGTVGGFSQANAEVNALLVQAVRELACTNDARVHELYAGHGNFSVALAPGSAEYVAVEQDAEAAARCQQNLKRRGLSARVVAGDAEANLGRGALDVLVLDPPRTGARGVLAEVVARKPERIVYVSCDLATLERDLRELAAEPYRIDAAIAFDMFPRTSQLETVVRLVRAR